MSDTETVLLSDIRLLTTMKLVDGDLVEAINTDIASADLTTQNYIFELMNDMIIPERNPQIVAANIFLGMHDTIETQIDPDLFDNDGSQLLRGEQEDLLKEYVNNEVVNHPFTFDVFFWFSAGLLTSAVTVFFHAVSS